MVRTSEPLATSTLPNGVAAVLTALEMSSPANQLSVPPRSAAKGSADEPIMRAVRMMW